MNHNKKNIIRQPLAVKWKSVALGALLLASGSLRADDHTVTLFPNDVPGTPRSENSATTSGYGSSSVQTHLRLDLSDDTDAVHFIRDNNDPYVLTRAYELKNADAYAVRGYLRAVVNSRRVGTSPTEVDALKFNDGRNVVIVSAEDYRFDDFANGESLDTLIERLDQPGLGFSSGRPKFIYFPKAQTAANLREMLRNVGAVGNDVEFTNGVDVLLVDAPLNALFIAAPYWSWKHIRNMLEEYDQPSPEVRISYRVIEIFAENDDKIGVDFQSWKNNDGVDLFSAGGRYRSNWAATVAGGTNGSGSSRTDFFNFNPKWNTKYLDFLASSGKAKVVASGVLAAKNRTTSSIEVSSGLFYIDASETIEADTLNSKIIEGRPEVPAATDANGVRVSPGNDFLIEHGKAIELGVFDGFRFELAVYPVVTGRSTLLSVALTGDSLIGWNSDGTPRLNTSEVLTEVQIGNGGKDFVIGGIQKCEVVRGTTGIPLLKDLPVLGWVFSTESESTKKSQLVLVARAEYAHPNDCPDVNITDNIGKIVDEIGAGLADPLHNFGFEQLILDTFTLE